MSSDARPQQQQQHDDTASDNSSELSSPRTTKTARQHPLEHAWTLWFHNPSRKTNAANYFNFLKQVYKFNTIEQFWGLYNHVMTPSKLGVGCTYYLFKEDIRPEWESPECVGGGEWMVQLPSRDTEKLDQYWLNAILGCIGAESFDKPLEDSICGVAVAIRKTQLRISLWLSPCEDKLIKRLGEQFRNAVLLLDADLTEEEKNQTQGIQFQYKSFAAQLKGARDPQYTIP